MKWTGLNELREKYLSFFESKGHLRLPSYPLIPQGDNSLLLINSGMAPMKKYFLGQEVPPRNRVTTCQKCIRTPDIERVGKTARHGTFFEMLGNFSFGDYFKVEATAWAWEFVTKVLEMPEDKLWVTIYLDDDEAFDIWTKQVGIPAERIVRMGKEDNFWEHGKGPCGPCSEIYFDRGEEKGCGSPDCKVGCECDRYVEFWNLVFSQFDSDGEGNYAKLAKPNIDTGMGLERLACIMQGVDNLFEVDTIQNIMKHICRIAGVEYHNDEKTDVSLRVITDHIRSTVFMIADGVHASNEGRGYVLRRLLRRAARHGRLLGIERPFLYEVVETVVNENRTAYPELAEKQDYITMAIKREEETFNKTIDKGFEMLTQLLDTIETKSLEDEEKILQGSDAFKLYDTYGFPLDLTIDIVEERGFKVDEQAFAELMQEQRARARADRLASGIGGWSEDNLELEGESTQFLGYTQLDSQAVVQALAADGERTDTVDAGKGEVDIVIVTDQTPFYAQSGGQVADIGTIVKADNAVVLVSDVQKTAKGFYLHAGKLVSGKLNVGDTVEMKVDKEYRQAVMRNHTAAHLLQAALIKVLGNHVHQAGQLVDNNRVRFDFSHFEAMSAEQIAQVERIINEKILEGIEVQNYETDIDSAKQAGATALFGEKYGDVVRVVNVEGFSMELCGGTHVNNTAKLGLFRIISESSAAAGVRRIEATTGLGVLELLNNADKTMAQAASILKISNVSELTMRCTSVMQEIKDKNAEIDVLTQKLADSKLEVLFDSVQQIGDVKYIYAAFSGTKPDSLRIMGDKIKEKAPNMVALIAGTYENKGNLLCVCGKNTLEKGMHAGKIVSKAAAVAGGKGGGRPDSAMAGVNDLFKIDEALSALPEIIKEMIK